MKTAVTCRETRGLFEGRGRSDVSLRTRLASELLSKKNIQAKVIHCIDHRLPLTCLAECFVLLDVIGCYDGVIYVAQERQNTSNKQVTRTCLCLEVGIRALFTKCRQSARECALDCVKELRYGRNKAKALYALLKLREIYMSDDGDMHPIVYGHGEGDCRPYILPPSNELVNLLLHSFHIDASGNNMLIHALDVRPDIGSSVDVAVLGELVHRKKYSVVSVFLERIDYERLITQNVVGKVLHAAICQMTPDTFTDTYDEYEDTDDDCTDGTDDICYGLKELVDDCLRNPHVRVEQRSLSEAIESPHVVPGHTLLKLIRHPSVTPEMRQIARKTAARSVERSRPVKVARLLDMDVDVTVRHR